MVAETDETPDVPDIEGTVKQEESHEKRYTIEKGTSYIKLFIVRIRYRFFILTLSFHHYLSCDIDEVVSIIDWRNINHISIIFLFNIQCELKKKGNRGLTPTFSKKI